jgi:hypothetical protein
MISMLNQCNNKASCDSDRLYDKSIDVEDKAITTDSMYVIGEKEYANCQSCHDYYRKSVSHVTLKEYSKNYENFNTALQRTMDSVYHVSIKRLDKKEIRAIFYYMNERYKVKY